MSLLWQTALVCFSAELGDKSFFLAVIFAAWCPFYGVRSGPGSSLQRCLVAAGAVAAVATRALLLMGADVRNTRLSHSLGLLASAVQAVLGVQALWHLRQADRSRHLELRPDAVNKATATEAGDARPKSLDAIDSHLHLGERGWLGSFKPYDPQAYGAVEHIDPPQCGSTNPFDADRLEDAEVSDNTGCAAGALLPSFAVPFFAIFLVEPADGFTNAIYRASTVSNALGAVSASAIAVIVAVAVGFLLERNLSERRLAFAAALGLWSLWLVTTSQDFLQFYGQNGLGAPAAAVNHLPAHHTLGAHVALPKTLRAPRFPQNKAAK